MPIIFRTLNELSNHRRAKIYQNWCFGRFEEQILFYTRQFHPTKLFLKKDKLYKTHGGELRIYKRLKNKHLIDRKPIKTFGAEKEEDIISFSVKSNEIFTGRRDGSINVYFDSAIDDISHVAHVDRVECVDFYNDLFVSTTLNETSLWSKKVELGIPNFDLLKSIPSGNKTVRLSPEGKRLATGKFSKEPGTALRMIDVET